MRAAERYVRDRRVLRLVRSGWSYRRTAAAVGLRSPSSVFDIVQRDRRPASALEAWRAGRTP